MTLKNCRTWNTAKNLVSRLITERFCETGIHFKHCETELPSMHCETGIHFKHCETELPSMHCETGINFKHCETEMPSMPLRHRTIIF
jgi:hypothetical protein